jgi:hypothetical protein
MPHRRPFRGWQARARRGIIEPSSTSPEPVMQLTYRTLCLLIAVILFVVDAFGINVSGISLVSLGLAFFAGSFLVPETSLSRR